jgi:undecaprenyl-diphosphatase
MTNSTATPHDTTPNNDAQPVSRPRAARRLRRAETYYLIALPLFAALAVFAYLYPYFSFDLATTRFLQSFNSPLLLNLMRAVSIPGNGITPHAITTLTLILFLLFRRRSEAAGLLLAAGGSAVLNSIIKLIIHRPRPAAALVTLFDTLGSLSFPSGHVTFYVCYFGFLFFAAYAILPRGSSLRRLSLTLTAIPVLLVGISRIYLGAHWLSDTLGAYLWSGVWLGFSLEMYRRWKARATFHSVDNRQKKSAANEHE